jgi:ATP-dependent protease HslVU (ClpYQ) ATPase subunit
MGTEGVTLNFTPDAIDALADVAVGSTPRSRTSARAACRP